MVVGVLQKDARTSFSFSRTYLDVPRRPVLGQAYEDDLRRRRLGGGGRLPAFFSNMLPEGTLRERLASALRLTTKDEFELLAALGADLPGAVTATPFDEIVAGYEAAGGEEEESPTSPPREDDVLRFSLAGVQFKLSMVREGERLTLPASGRGGNWIVKLPSPGYPSLPENEHVTMTWAGRAGINVAEHELMPLGKLIGVPQQLLEGLSGKAFITRRYDRMPEGQCIHQEDFAQVFDVYPERKYDATNHETIANVILRLTGQEGFKEFLQRLIFVVLSGNGDAHLKNWSLYYPDKIHARLSPAYDLVATIQYLPKQRLALNFAKSKSFDDVSLAGFQRLARKLDVDEAEVTETVRSGVAAVLAAWRDLRGDMIVSKVYSSRVEEHLRKLPLAKAG